MILGTIFLQILIFSFESSALKPLNHISDDSNETTQLSANDVTQIQFPDYTYENLERPGKYESIQPTIDSISDTLLVGRQKRRGGVRYRRKNDISLWLDEEQVRRFSGYPMEIHAIVDGRVMPFLLEPDFEQQLPVIPSDVNAFNFTWKAGRRKYFYHFNVLSSFSTNILQDPYISIKKKGRIPKKPKVFSVHIPCHGKTSGVASFAIGLVIRTKRGSNLANTPLKFHLRKQCDNIADRDHICDEKCDNGGKCDENKHCKCLEGYMGTFCNTALCYPQCRNGGFCSSPGRCSCPPGYHGRNCEGGICSNKCMNGGKCVQKDICSCRKGHYGNQCEFSKCVIPCINGGKCRGINKCRCKVGYSGDHCEILTSAGLSLLLNRCAGKCRRGKCLEQGTCLCKKGFTGRWCRRKLRKSKLLAKLWV